MRNNFTKFIHCFCFLILIFCVGTTQVKAEKLKKIAPQTKVFDPDGAHTFYAADVSLEVVKLLASIPLENLKTEDYPTIYKVPSTKNLYLVTVIRNEDTESEYVLFKHENNQLKELCRSSTIENAIVDTTFFVGKTTILIIADIAVPPDFTGLQAFELKNEKLLNLGNLCVAEKNKTTGLHDDFISPIENAGAEVKSGIYYLTFRGNLYSDWGGVESEEKKLNSPTVFYYDQTNKSFKIYRKM